MWNLEAHDGRLRVCNLPPGQRVGWFGCVKLRVTGDETGASVLLAGSLPAPRSTVKGGKKDGEVTGYTHRSIRAGAERRALGAR